MTTQTQTATFAGGCFWCMQPPFDQLDGVLSTMPGYAGGHVDSPSYEQVCSGDTGHTEVIQISFDPERVSYPQLLEVFWRNIDPTAVNRQFVDRGSQYRTAIFYHNEEQRRQAEASRAALDASGRYDQPVVTEITALEKFYPAEDYHHDFYRKNPLRYQSYHLHSGREQYLHSIWGDEPDDNGG
jgi:methionine-S-sulfoxide reductase